MNFAAERSLEFNLNIKTFCVDTAGFGCGNGHVSLSDAETCLHETNIPYPGDYAKPPPSIDIKHLTALTIKRPRHSICRPPLARAIEPSRQAASSTFQSQRTRNPCGFPSNMVFGHFAITPRTSRLRRKGHAIHPLVIRRYKLPIRNSKRFANYHNQLRQERSYCTQLSSDATLRRCSLRGRGLCRYCPGSIHYPSAHNVCCPLGFAHIHTDQCLDTKSYMLSWSWCRSEHVVPRRGVPR